MSFRILDVAKYILVISFSLFFHNQLKNFFKKMTSLSVSGFKEDFHQINKIFQLILVILLNFSNSIALVESNLYQNSLQTNYPTNLKIFESVDFEYKVFLTSAYDVTPYIPIYLFLSPNIHLEISINSKKTFSIIFP